MRKTRLEVNLSNIKYNIGEIKKYLGNDIEIMPIVKANGYGTYLNFNKDILNSFKIVGVALLDEAITLREIGYDNDIFILYPLIGEELDYAIDNGFIINSSNLLDINSTRKYKGKKIRTHLEVETGMGRTGLLEKNIDEFITMLKDNANIKMEGLFTHLSSSRTDYDFSIRQLEKFKSVISKFKENNIKVKYIHAICSGGLYDFKDYLYNMVRVGLLIYGYYPNDSIKKIIKLKPSITLKTNITYLKEIEKGECVGYNKNFIAKDKTKVATIPFGFADGLVGLDTGKAYVVINKQKAMIIGICMDNMMVDVTSVENIKIGDEVYIWDNEVLTVEEVALWINDLCNYEIISSISSRVAREFVE